MVAASSLNSSLITLQQALNNLTSACGGIPVCQNAVPSIPSRPLNYDFSAVSYFNKLTS